jgi:hypothetical protein
MFGMQQANAMTFTVATFADPSPGAGTPLFSYDGPSMTLSGGWSGTGLTLETIVGDFTDATFTLSSTVAPLGGDSGSGTIEFFDSASDPLLTINFDVASLAVIGFGSTEFLAVDTDSITMSGPVISVGFGMPTVDQEESFSFSFANQIAIDAQGGFSATSAFTSSTTTVPIPEPASLTLLACAAGLVLRRRRRSQSKGAFKMLVVMGGMLAFAGQAQAGSFTVASFADPATDSSTPLFELNNDLDLLSGSWTGLGLTLQTPGLGDIDYSDAMFSMAPVTVNPDDSTGPGTVTFRASNQDLLFTITFQSGTLNGNTGFGATDFVAQGVEISVAIGPFTLMDEAFSFSFANQAATANGFTASAGFTSSATPEPASLGLTAIGAVLLMKRRRRS